MAVAAVIILAALLMTHPWGNIQRDSSAIAYADSAAIQSGRMVIFVTSADRPQQQLIEVEWVSPDNYHGKIGEDIDAIEFVVTQDKQYFKGADLTDNSAYAAGGQWYYFVHNQGARELLDLLTDVHKLPDEVIDRVECQHYLSRIDMDRQVNRSIEELESTKTLYPDYYSDEQMDEMRQQFEQARAIKIMVEFWIGKDDSIFRQIKMYSSDIAVGEMYQLDATSLLVKYYDINQPISIQPPETSSGELLPGWRSE